MFKSQRQQPSPRRGAVLVCVIVCLSIATALVTAATQSALRARRQVRVERQLRQVELLLEAGAQRAVAKLNESAEYESETWSLAADVLPGFESASVEIKTESADGQQTRKVHIVAQLPADSDRPVRRSYEFNFQRSETPVTTEE